MIIALVVVLVLCGVFIFASIVMDIQEFKEAEQHWQAFDEERKHENRKNGRDAFPSQKID
jgi:hypothetical protein